MVANNRDEIINSFYASLPSDITDDEFVKRVKSIHNIEEREVIAQSVCDKAIDDLSLWYGWNYPDDCKLSNDYVIKTLFKPLIQYIKKKKQSYYEAVSLFFDGDFSKSFELLKLEIDGYIKDGSVIDETWFAYGYSIFKGSIPKLYDYILERIRNESYENGLPELIKATKTYFCTTDLAELEKDVSAALLLAPDSILAKELISIVSYNNKHWQNTIAILENIQDGYILSEAERYFILAWCNSKIRRKKESIEYYQKCLENEPMKPWARNNLAYELYLTKQYKQAEKEYRFCIDNKIDLKYACSGYVRTLAALGKFDEADSFIKITPEKIYKNALDILKDAKSGKKKFFEANDEPQYDDFPEIIDKKQRPSYQFSKESILEDELTERLEVGSTVFDIPLKIYKRKGIYGRQWTFPGIGRIDLLAEDKDGNLYIIELKKDSGYDDAYAQTVKYVEWFEKSKYAKGKKVYGIICVNEPPKKLIKAVHDDHRIRLFEYKISYSEIK